MDTKFVNIDSIVNFITLDDNELESVKITKSKLSNSPNEISKDSLLGEVLMFHKEGDILTVPAQEPYKIQILTIINPVPKQKNDPIIFAPNAKSFNVNEFVLADTTNHASYESNLSKGLIIGHAYGAKARNVYKSGILNLGWDSSKLTLFSQKGFYATNCTKDGFSVWLIPYSNMNNYHNSENKCNYFINSKFDTIKEYWKPSTTPTQATDKRITFAKQKNGQYLYLGIFQATETPPQNNCITYQKI